MTGKIPRQAQPTDAFSAPIAAAYRAFRDYPCVLSPSSMQWTRANPEVLSLEEQVLATPLRELDAQTLRRVFWNATADERSIKHFVPRVVECIAEGTMTLADLTTRVRAETIATWPEAERRALLDALGAEQAARLVGSDAGDGGC